MRVVAESLVLPVGFEPTHRKALEAPVLPLNYGSTNPIYHKAWGASEDFHLFIVERLAHGGRTGFEPDTGPA